MIKSSGRLGISTYHNTSYINSTVQFLQSTLHLLGLSVQFGVRASEDYDHPFLLFYTFGGFLAKYLYRYSRRHAMRIYPRYKQILVR